MKCVDRFEMFSACHCETMPQADGNLLVRHCGAGYGPEFRPKDTLD